MITTFGDSQFVEFNKMGSGFIPRAKLIEAKITETEELQRKKEIDKQKEELMKNEPGMSMVRFQRTNINQDAFPKLDQLSISQQRGNATSPTDQFSKVPSRFDMVENVANNQAKFRNTEADYNSMSQFSSFVNLVNEDEKLYRNINNFCNNNDHLGLIKHKLQNNKTKAEEYKKNMKETTDSKQHYYSSILHNFNDKMDLMKNHMKVLKNNRFPTEGNSGEGNQRSPLTRKSSTLELTKSAATLGGGLNNMSGNLGNSSMKKAQSPGEGKGPRETKVLSDFESLYRNQDLGFCFPIDNNAWKPGSREGHSQSMLNIGGKLTCAQHGGLSGSIFSDFYGFELGKWHWKALNQFEGVLEPRFGHSSNSSGSKILIYGGCKSFSAVLKALLCSNELIMLDIQDKSYQVIKPKYGGPSGRKYHTSNLMGSTLFIIGGINSKNKVLNDIWTYNLSNFCFIKKFRFEKMV